MTTEAPMAMETKARPWWALLIQGILAVGIGAILLWAPAKTAANTYQLLIFFLGIYWLIGGIMDLVHLFTDRTAWGWKLFMGVLSILAGFYILAYPAAAAVVIPQAFVLVLGIWGLMQGAISLLLAFRGGGWGIGIPGVLSIIFGVILLANYGAPGMGLTLIWTTAVFALIGGMALIVQAFRQRAA
jgi:uncharacterized membrane protein HdeD (DUF308 family)